MVYEKLTEFLGKIINQDKKNALFKDKKDSSILA